MFSKDFISGATFGFEIGRDRVGSYVIGEEELLDIEEELFELASEKNCFPISHANVLYGYRYGYRIGASGERLPEDCNF